MCKWNRIPFCTPLRCVLLCGMRQEPSVQEHHPAGHDLPPGPHPPCPATTPALPPLKNIDLICLKTNSGVKPWSSTVSHYSSRSAKYCYYCGRLLECKPFSRRESQVISLLFLQALFAGVSFFRLEAPFHANPISSPVRFHGGSQEGNEEEIQAMLSPPENPTWAAPRRSLCPSLFPFSHRAQSADVASFQSLLFLEDQGSACCSAFILSLLFCNKSVLWLATKGNLKSSASCCTALETMLSWKQNLEVCWMQFLEHSSKRFTHIYF